LLCYNQKTKKEGEVNVVVIAFFSALQPKNKKKKVTTMLPSSPSLLCYNKKTKKKKVTTTLMSSPSLLRYNQKT
jgi:hypothetical protein